MLRVIPCLFTLGWLLFAVTASAVIERRVEHRFEVPGDAVLKVDVFSGIVNVSAHDDAHMIEVVVLQTAEVTSEDAMDEHLATLSLSFKQHKNGAVLVGARYVKPVSFSWTAWPPVNLVYEIKVPRRSDVTIETGEGRIAIGALEGRINVRNQAGEIFIGEIDGSIIARSDTGRVGITAATGTIKATTVTGNITVGRTGTHTRVASGGGFIEVQRVRGELVVRGSGSNADVGFDLPIRRPADISLSGGTLTLIVEKPSECTLDMRASVFGKVSVRGELPLNVVAGGAGRSGFKAHVNGGGPRIMARAKGGNILVRAVDPLPLLVADDVERSVAR